MSTKNPRLSFADIRHHCEMEVDPYTPQLRVLLLDEQDRAKATLTLADGDDLDMAACRLVSATLAYNAARCVLFSNSESHDASTIDAMRKATALFNLMVLDLVQVLPQGTRSVVLGR